jgi:hypothetical protein
MILQDAMLASSPPGSGHKPKKHETLRACPFLENRSFDARTGAVLELGPAPEFRLVPRRGSSAKSTVCGLNRLLPMLRIGTLYLNPRPRSALLRLRLFAPCWKRKLTFPFWKDKLRLAHFFSPKRNPKIPGEKGKRKANGSSKTATAIELKRLRKHAYYYEISIT